MCLSSLYLHISLQKTSKNKDFKDNVNVKMLFAFYAYMMIGTAINIIFGAS